MTEKRFYKTNSDIEKYRIYDDDKEDAYFLTCDEHTVDCLTDLLNELNNENERLKKELSLRKVNVEDIIGLIHTDEPTNSVELKKELYK